MNVATSRALVQVVKGALLSIAVLGLTAYKWPPNTVISDQAVYDYIVVGAGSAGSIVANRLTEDANITVLVVEAGANPPIEVDVPGLFAFLTKTYMDWNYVSENDGYSAQYHRNKYLDLPTGKVLGGSSCIHHFYYLRGSYNDYQDWVNATGDDSWSWDNLLPYFIKSERLEDDYILQSETGHYHGTEGNVGITRELRELPLKYLEAFRDVGYKVMDDINDGKSFGFTRPMVFIANGIRQSSAQSFLSPIKDRPNLHVAKSTIVNKILFDDNKNAIGVQVSTASGQNLNIFARKEVIVSAGTFNTPKLLMLSGIGPQDHLKDIGIEVVSDLPVGEGLEDHMAVILAHKLETVIEPATIENPFKFPLPTFVGLGALDELQKYPDFLTLNLILRNNPSLLLILCSTVFGLHDDVCEQLNTAGQNREILVTIMNIARPLSQGRVLLRSLDPNDPPKIYTGFLSNSTDLENNAAYISDFIKVTKSKYFEQVGGETIYFNLPNCDGIMTNTTDYWKCYVLNMMDTTFHYTSTCRMGSVLDSKMQVLGVQKLRVVDASAMPNIISGNTNSAVMVLAEKASDLIKEANSISS